MLTASMNLLFLFMFSIKVESLPNKLENDTELKYSQYIRKKRQCCSPLFANFGSISPVGQVYVPLIMLDKQYNHRPENKNDDSYNNDNTQSNHQKPHNDYDSQYLLRNHITNRYGNIYIYTNHDNDSNYQPQISNVSYVLSLEPESVPGHQRLGYYYPYADGTSSKSNKLHNNDYDSQYDHPSHQTSNYGDTYASHDKHSNYQPQTPKVLYHAKYMPSLEPEPEPGQKRPGYDYPYADDTSKLHNNDYGDTYTSHDKHSNYQPQKPKVLYHEKYIPSLEPEPEQGQKRPGYDYPYADDTSSKLHNNYYGSQYDQQHYLKSKYGDTYTTHDKHSNYRPQKPKGSYYRKYIPSPKPELKPSHKRRGYDDPYANNTSSKSNTNIVISRTLHNNDYYNRENKYNSYESKYKSNNYPSQIMHDEPIHDESMHNTINSGEVFTKTQGSLHELKHDNMTSDCIWYDHEKEKEHNKTHGSSWSGNGCKALECKDGVIIPDSSCCKIETHLHGYITHYFIYQNHGQKWIKSCELLACNSGLIKKVKKIPGCCVYDYVDSKQDGESWWAFSASTGNNVCKKGTCNNGTIEVTQIKYGDVWEDGCFNYVCEGSEFKMNRADLPGACNMDGGGCIANGASIKLWKQCLHVICINGKMFKLALQECSTK